MLLLFTEVIKNLQTHPEDWTIWGTSLQNGKIDIIIKRSSVDIGYFS